MAGGGSSRRLVRPAYVSRPFLEDRGLAAADQLLRRGGRASKPGSSTIRLGEAAQRFTGSASGGPGSHAIGRRRRRTESSDIEFANNNPQGSRSSQGTKGPRPEGLLELIECCTKTDVRGHRILACALANATLCRTRNR